MKAILSLILLVGLSANASILPKNDLHLEDNLFSEDANMTEEEFDAIIDRVADRYRDIVASHGATLDMVKKWTDSTVNAYAQQTGTTWKVSMFGGLARRPETTKDGFALVVCHELGHHLGGFPFYGSDWASSEGQSDYFATQSCSRRIWSDQPEINAESRATVHPTAKAKCDLAWPDNEAEQNLCYRTAMGGHSLATLLAALGNSTVDFDRPDLSEVAHTNPRHPKGQCRLDTYLNGALCDAIFDINVIPGRRHPNGQTSSEAEMDAARHACTRAAFQADAARPKCWFKPRVESLVVISEMNSSEVNGNGNGHVEPGEGMGIGIKLENLSTQAYENVSAKLAASDKFEIIRGEINHDRLEPGVADQAAGFEIKMTGATCGEKVDVSVSLHVGEKRAATVGDKVLIGRPVATEALANNTPLPIPDFEPAGVTSTITVANNEPFSQATVAVDITHTYSGDITLNLISPDEKIFELQKRKGGGADDIKKSFIVELPSGVTSTGDWKLSVADSARRDEGQLNSWSIQFNKVVCD